MATYIDQALVKKIEPAAADTYIRDTEVTGFQLKVTPTGKLIYRFTYRSPIDKRQRAITLGAEPRMSSQSARAAAIQCAQAVEAGRDPAPEQREVRHVPTLAEAWAEFAAAHTAEPGDDDADGEGDARGQRTRSKSKRKTWRPSTAKEYGRIFDEYVDTKLKSRRVNEISFGDMDRMVQKIARDHGPIMAHNVKKRMSTLYVWAMTGERYGIPISNPAVGIKTDEPTSKHFVFERDELFKLDQTLSEMARKEWAPNILVLKFLLFTGARKHEALNLQWSEVDLKERKLTLSPERHKTGSQTGERTIALGSEALATLETALAFSKAQAAVADCELSPYVFPSKIDYTKPIVGLQKIWERVRTKAGISARIHDIRHNFGGVGGETVHQIHVREALGHRKLHTTDKYMKARHATNVEAVDKINAAIRGDMKPANVVAFGGKK